MTLSTIRGATGDIRLLYMFFANVKSSCDIAFYIAATHGGIDVAYDVLEAEREATYGMMVTVWAAALLSVLGPAYKSWKDVKTVFSSMPRTNLSSVTDQAMLAKKQALGRIGMNFAQGGKQIIGYAWLMPAFWDLYMFNLESTSELQLAITEMKPEEFPCKWMEE